jgi:hypothetical protein
MEPFLTTPRADLRHQKILDAAHHLAAVAAEGPEDRLLTVRLYGHWVTSAPHSNGSICFHIFASLARRIGPNLPALYVRLDRTDEDRVIVSTAPPGMKVNTWDYRSEAATRFSCAPLAHHLESLGYPMKEKHFFRAEVHGNRLVIDTSRSFDKRAAIIHERDHPECRGPRSRFSVAKPSSPRAS